MVMPSRRLWTVLLCVAMATTLSNGCTYTNITSATVTNGSPSQVMCTISEDAAVGTSVCQFSVPGNTPVTLTRYSDPDITTYAGLNSEYDSVNDVMVLTVTLTGSVNVYADTSSSSLLGNLNCGSPSDLLILTINKVNDQTPQFESPTYELPDVSEGFPKGYDLLSIYGVAITATDGDTAGDSSSIMDFSIISGNDDGTFSVSKDDACSSTSCAMLLKVVGTIDYQTHPQYELTLQVQDEGTPSLSSTATLTITVQDVDNLDPKFDHTFYYADVTDLNNGSYPLDITPDPINAVDQDTGINAPLTYSLLIDTCGDSCDAVSAAFSVDPTTGVITFDSTVDIEPINNRVATFGIQATQTDNKDRSTIAIVSVTLPPSDIPTTTPQSITTETTVCPTVDTVTTPATTITTTANPIETTVTTCTTVTYPTGSPPPDPTTTNCPTAADTTVVTLTTNCPTDTTTSVTTSQFTTTSAPYTITTNSGSTVTISISDSPTDQSPITSYTCNPTAATTGSTAASTSPTACPTGSTTFPTGSSIPPTFIPTVDPTGITSIAPTLDPTARTTTSHPTNNPPTVDTTAATFPTGMTCFPTSEITQTTSKSLKPTDSTPTTCPDCQTTCAPPVTCSDTTTSCPICPITCPSPVTCSDTTTSCPVCPTVCPSPVTCSDITTTCPPPVTCPDIITTTCAPCPTTIPPTCPPPTPCPPCPSADNTTETHVLVSVLTALSTKVAQVAIVNFENPVYSIHDNEFFAVDQDGNIYVTSYLKVTASRGYTVTATDSTGLVTDDAVINIQIVDEAQIAAFAVNYDEVSLDENSGPQILIDLNSTFEGSDDHAYSIVSVSPPCQDDQFTVDSVTGVVSVTTDLDYETASTCDIIVEVDALNDTESLTSATVDQTLNNNQALVRVMVTDVNDNPPEFMDGDATVSELIVGISSYTTSGQQVIQLQTTDKDTDDKNKIVYYAIDVNSNFYVDSNSGVVYASTPINGLTVGNSYDCVITASNENPGGSSTLKLTINNLQDTQILVIDYKATVEEFEQNSASILSQLSSSLTSSSVESKLLSSTNINVRALKWVADGDAVTKVYLYAIADSQPMQKDDLLNLLKQDSEAFSDSNFDTSGATTFDQTAEASEIANGSSDNTGYIVGISILAALLGITIIIGAVYGWKAHKKSQKRKKELTQFMDDENFGKEKDINQPSELAATHNTRRLSQAINMEAMHIDEPEETNSIHEEHESVKENHLYPEIDYKDLSPTYSNDIVNELETANEEKSEINDLISENRENSPDYLNEERIDIEEEEEGKSILVDPSIKSSDTLEEMQMKEDLVVTFDETPEVIVHEVDANDHHNDDDDDDDDDENDEEEEEEQLE